MKTNRKRKMPGRREREREKDRFKHTEFRKIDDREVGQKLRLAWRCLFR